tara:strand:+ start:216 stop:995 length:780 start_codon:yes stop_codon:yes gene_type:complete
VLPKFLKPYHIKSSNLVRIGPKTDGGYIIDKRILSKINILITCGLNDDWEFERSFLKKKPAAKIIAFDHTVNNHFWIKRFKNDIISLLLLRKLRISKILDIFKFIDYLLFFTKNKKHKITKVVFKKKNNKEITISEILKDYKEVFLKIDIEGDEYKILNDIKKNSKKIVFLVIEFHNLDKNILQIKKFLEKLDLKIIHIHANNYGGIDKYGNPKVIELSLLNRKKIKLNNTFSKKKYPIVNLDYKNFKRREDIKIKFNE